jgi:preprotein translocase subunit SecG
VEILIPFIKVIHIIVCLFLIILILLQPGKGGDLGSVFGGGSSESVFGSSGAAPFLTKLTRLLALIFVITSLSLGYFSVQSIKSSVITDAPAVEQNAPSQEDSGTEASSNPDENGSPTNQDLIDSLTAPQEDPQTAN